MKSLFKSILTAAGLMASAAGFVACQDDIDEQIAPSIGNEEAAVKQITFQMPEFVFEDEGATTRVVPEITDRGAHFTWSENDTIGVFPEADYPYQVAFPISEEFAGTTSAAFDGGVWRLRENLKYAAYYPFSYYNADKNRIEINMDGQLQKGNATVEHLKNYICMMSLPQEVNDEGKVNFAMTFLTTLVRIELTLPANYNMTGKTLNRLTLQSNKAEFVNRGYIDIVSSPKLTAVKKTLQFSIELSNMVPENGKLIIYTMMNPGDFSKSTFKVRLQGTDVLTGTMTGKSIEAGKAYMMTSALKVEPKASQSYIDLGVPSGTLWASSNLEAEKTYSAGALYSWGETASKTSYTFSRYAYGAGTNRFNKYVTNSEKYGESTWWLFRTFYFVDNISELEDQDDAAIFNLGYDYRIPTPNEFQELIDYCDWTYTTEQGVKGWKVQNRKKKDAYIFLADGGNKESGTETAGYGYYWTSKLNTTNNTQAKCLMLDGSKKTYSISDASRHRGLQIHPVYIGAK